ncbi:MAG: ATP-binding cassette domain-containing protein, partial [Planctomycetota bacterium]|nr:ATP-binding cassette domain-containing protein [Planctomycetota bacterium]
MLELRQVHKTFGGHAALDGVSLRIERAATTALIGPSGCGKSTALRTMIGLLRPGSGDVLFDGEALTGANVRRARRRMGYVIQEGGLFPHMTARRNASLMARHLGWERARTEARVEELANLTRLDLAMLDRYPAELSGGQRQRV